MKKKTKNHESVFTSLTFKTWYVSHWQLREQLVKKKKRKKETSLSKTKVWKEKKTSYESISSI